MAEGRAGAIVPLALYGQSKSLEAALKLKERGNNFFHGKMFTTAEEYYTKVHLITIYAL